MCLISNIFSSLANSILFLSLLYPLCLPTLWLARSYSIWDTWLFGPKIINFNSFTDFIFVLLARSFIQVLSRQLLNRIQMDIIQYFNGSRLVWSFWRVAMCFTEQLLIVNASQNLSNEVFNQRKDYIRLTMLFCSVKVL